MEVVNDQGVQGSTGAQAAAQPASSSSQAPAAGPSQPSQASSLEYYKKRCATCGCQFESRNQLHRHLERTKHQRLGRPPDQNEAESMEQQMISHFRGKVGLSGCDIEDPSGSVKELPPDTDEAGSRQLSEQDAHGQIADQPKPICSVGKGHPGQKVPTHQITARDQQWHDVGSGVVARTFKRVSRLRTTSAGGPCMDDIAHRRVWSLSSGRMIDECEVDTTSDAELNRTLPEVDDIRVELTLKNAAELYRREGPDVVELYSQPRVCQEVGGRDFAGTRPTPGYSLDLTVNDPATGEPWDLSKPTVQSKVRKLIRDTKPYCIIGSPLCTAFSPLQEISRAKRDPAKVRRQLKDAQQHIRFCAGMYQERLRNHRHFVHEHPAKSKAWQMPEMKALMMRPEVGLVVMDMCAFGMTGSDDKGVAPVKKSTRIMGSSQEVLRRLDRRCASTGGVEDHRHVHLIQGRAKAA